MHREITNSVLLNQPAAVFSSALASFVVKTCPGTSAPHLRPEKQQTVTLLWAETEKSNSSEPHYRPFLQRRHWEHQSSWEAHRRVSSLPTGHLQHRLWTTDSARAHTDLRNIVEGTLFTTSSVLSVHIVHIVDTKVILKVQHLNIPRYFIFKDSGD